jgi:hypothetical protein
MLVERLAALVDNGIFVRGQDPGHAARHLYNLTAVGRDVWPALHALLRWGARLAGPNQLRFLHVACGAEIDDYGNCPTCRLAPPPTDIATEPRNIKPGGRTDPVAVALRERHTLLQLLIATP